MTRLTPKDKAKELIDKCKEYCFHNFDNDAEEQRMNNAKQCALILADEFIEWCKPDSDEDCGFSLAPSYNYWNSVKLELENTNI